MCHRCHRGHRWLVASPSGPNPCAREAGCEFSLLTALMWRPETERFSPLLQLLSFCHGACGTLGFFETTCEAVGADRCNWPSPPAPIRGFKTISIPPCVSRTHNTGTIRLGCCGVSISTPSYLWNTCPLAFRCAHSFQRQTLVRCLFNCPSASALRNKKPRPYQIKYIKLQLLPHAQLWPWLRPYQFERKCLDCCTKSALSSCSSVIAVSLLQLLLIPMRVQIRM